MLENIRLAFGGIWSHKMRSFLTMLGIIIGIASIISIVSTIRGTNEQIKENLIGAGNNNVDVRLYQGEGEYYIDQGLPEGVNVISEEQKEEIRALEGVKNASFYNRRTYIDGITYQDRSLDSGGICGTDLNYLQTKGYVVKNGRGFVEEDITKIRKVALLDDTAVQTLFPGEDPIGKTLEIRGEPFTIVGNICKSEAFEPVINSISDYYMYNQDSFGLVVIPQTTWPIIFNFDEPMEVSIMAESTDTMSSLGKKVEDIMNQAVVSQQVGGEESGDASVSYKAADLLETVKNLQRVSENTNKQLLWIASISLLVGGIGVMNIMLVSVTERTSEIGLKKAIGARKRKILWQFLTEAAVLTSIGGILGVIAGIVLSQVIARMSQTPVAISMPAGILAVVFSMAIGIIFGLLPSIKAANLNPIDALRHE
ncbi:MAG: FtsX-like permease family protein [Clostridia bacterium]|nr:FtsX-like permease family protein [Clostridia bacterium]NCC42845.1 FtsX-like permease family protein [Clostridia bacterium]